MDFAPIIRQLGRGSKGAQNLTQEEAQLLYGAMLDGHVPDLELGAIAIALRMKGETVEEMIGFLSAVTERLYLLRAPRGSVRPIIVPTYNGARRSANLTPLLALLLNKFSIPVVLHGVQEAYERVTTAQIFQEFGLMPCDNLCHAQQLLDENGLVYVPLSILSSGLESQLALRNRLGLRNCAHSLVKMIDPFGGEGLMLAAATHPDYLNTMRSIFSALGAYTILLRGTEGEPFANPKRCPRIEYLHDGLCDTLVEVEHESLKVLPDLPETCDAKVTADWMRKVLCGEILMPQSLANQLACCLYASGYADDLDQARAKVSAFHLGR